MNGATTAETSAQNTRPTILPVVAENIPDELKRLPQWVTWKLESRDGRWTKRPYEVDGNHYAKANDPQTWGSFQDALTTYEWGTVAGVGFEPTAELGLVFVDIDHCIDLSAKKLAPWAMEIIERFDTYIERSPIDVVRIITKGKLPRSGQKKGGIEVYSASHYLTVTGQKIKSKPATIELLQEAIDWLLETHFKQREERKSTNGNGGAWNPSDDELLQKAFAARNGDKLKRLFEGDTSDHNGDDSAADLALCAMLRFWTQDGTQIDRIFRRSGLMRDKWDSRRGDSTYGERTIEKARASRSEQYEYRGNGHAATPEAEWGEPGLIQPALHPVPAFDPETLLPDVLRAWIMDEAERMPCPPDFLAAAAIVALGAIIGARCAIKPKANDDWLIVPNVWGGIVGIPSARKSPATSAALKPLDRLIARAIEAHKAEMEAFEAQATVFAAQKEAIEHEIKRAAKSALPLESESSNGTNDSTLESLSQKLRDHTKNAPREPKPRRYKTNDTTVEKLGELLRENPAGLLVLRDEIVGLISSWDREGREGERAFFLEAWNGNQSFDTDRIGRGSILIPNLCVSIFGGIQPDKLTEYLEQAAYSLANDGMLQRFQVMVYPDLQGWEWRDRTPAKDARNQAFTVFETLAEFDPLAWGAAPADDFAKFPYFRFDPEAQEIFIEWSTDLHRVRLPTEEQPIIQQHLTKLDKLFPALALILHLTECATTDRRGAVSKETALRAAAWCDYLEAHARRCYGLLKDDGLRAAQALADKIRTGKLKDEFTARDVRRNQWRYLTTDETVQAAIDWLVDESWLRAREVGGSGPGTGRWTWRYYINPAVRPSGSRE